jgi:hypothetical protein
MRSALMMFAKKWGTPAGGRLRLRTTRLCNSSARLAVASSQVSGARTVTSASLPATAWVPMPCDVPNCRFTVNSPPSIESYPPLRCCTHSERWRSPARRVNAGGEDLTRLSCAPAAHRFSGGLSDE